MTTSEQARADALADAETLGRLIRSMHGVESCPSAAPYLCGMVPAAGATMHYIRHRNPRSAYLNARKAALAAFRAVPGLR